MKYSISELAKLAGVSTRTLRYYDEIQLLKPAEFNSSGYRVYGQKEVDRLQQILFFRELEVDLQTIISIINDPNFNKTKAMQSHYEQLIKERVRLDKLIKTIEQTIADTKGEYSMSNEEKFAAFKEKAIADNEKVFGEEIRQLYGEERVNEANTKWRGLSEEDYEQMQRLEKHIFELLEQALELGDPTSEQAQEAAAKHKDWLSYSWSHYSKEAHAGLADMYVADERFREYYDRAGKGATELLRDAILVYTGQK